MNSPAIDAQGLTRTVSLRSGDDLHILRGADLTVAHGESVAVVGRSGSGKSTLLAILGLLAKPEGGALHLSGRDALAVSDAARARMRNEHLGFIFQNYSLLPHLSAAENVELPLLQGTRVRRKAARTAVAEALTSVGLGERGSARPRELSGGEQQRVAIARALVRRPGLVLADEPTGALDEDTAELVLDVLQTAVNRLGTTLLLVTHDKQIARRTNRVLSLHAGRLSPSKDDP